MKGMRSLSLQSLAEYDNGVLGAAFKLELQKMILDMENRPSLKKPRTITLKITMTPEDLNGPSGLDEVSFHCDISSKAPNRVSRSLPMKCGANGDLLFNANSPENPDQMTFSDIEEEVDENLQ